ncbi:hypothetical protein NL108_013213 [Boleophthalmus pectinirostris]|nr:hypothetical protein NL108_013213 [Boleophthalmus pectinirostris]
MAAGPRRLLLLQVTAATTPLSLASLAAFAHGPHRRAQPFGHRLGQTHRGQLDSLSVKKTTTKRSRVLKLRWHCVKCPSRPMPCTPRSCRLFSIFWVSRNVSVLARDAFSAEANLYKTRVSLFFFFCRGKMKAGTCMEQ